MPAPPAPANGRPRPAATRTALVLASAALAVIAVTVALVLRGPLDRTTPLRTVSVAPLRSPPNPVRRGDATSWILERSLLRGWAGGLADRVGRALDGRSGLVWLPNAGATPSADIRITGFVDWAADGAYDSLAISLEVPGVDGVDTIRGTLPADGTGAAALAGHVLDVLDARRTSLPAPGGSAASPSVPIDELPSLVLRQRHGKPWSAAILADLVARGDAFPIVERAILGAAAIEDLPARLDSLEAVAARFDAYWPARWMYADALAHYGALAGRSVDEVEAALREAAAMVPRPGPRRLDRHLEALAAGRNLPADGAPGWAARGAWDSAFVRSAPSPDADAGALLDAYRLAVVGNWLGGVPPSAVAGRRRPVREEQLDAAGGAELAWLDGLAAAVAQDGAAIDRARLRLRESGAPSATDLERSLRALQLATVEGEELRGARLLRSLERERADRLRLAMIEDDGHPYLTGVNRLAAALWFIKHGRSSDALPLLGWWERLPVGAPGIEVADAVLAPVDELQRARAYREVGRPADAARHFRRFLDGYDLAAGAHRTWVRDARAALEGRP